MGLGQFVSKKSNGERELSITGTEFLPFTLTSNYDMEKDKCELASHVIFAYNFASKTLTFDQKCVLLAKWISYCHFPGR